MNKVYLGLGSNLGDKNCNIDLAVSFINDRIGAVVRCSSIYETKPVGFTSENMFANAVCLVHTQLLPLDILEITQQIEREMGRSAKSNNEVYADRIIDIDILMYNEDIIDLPELTLPHPHMHERMFVIQPLSEIAGNTLHPILKKTVEELKHDLGKS